MPLQEPVRTSIEKYLQSLSEKEFRFELVDNKNTGTGSVKLGTYGIIRGATTFIIGIMDNSYKNVEKFGYVFEKAVLFLTDMGLGTCWLGGTFNKQQFSKPVRLKENEFIPIVSPVGYPCTGINVMNSIVRIVAGSDKRFPREKLFFENTFSNTLSTDAAGKYREPLEMVRLAPSASNKQPWRILKNENGYHFFLSRDPNYSRLLKYDIQRNDIGIAMCHFELCAEELMLQGLWTIDQCAVELSGSFEYITTWKIS